MMIELKRGLGKDGNPTFPISANTQRTTDGPTGWSGSLTVS